MSKFQREISPTNPYRFADRSPKQMSAARKGEEISNELFTRKARELLNNLKTADGQPVELSTLLLGPAKVFGETLSRSIDQYYRDVFDWRDTEQYFALFVKKIFDEIFAEVEKQRGRLREAGLDPSRGTLPSIDEYTAQIFTNTFLRAKKKKVA